MEILEMIFKVFMIILGSFFLGASILFAIATAEVRKELKRTDKELEERFGRKK